MTLPTLLSAIVEALRNAGATEEQRGISKFPTAPERADAQPAKDAERLGERLCAKKSSLPLAASAHAVRTFPVRTAHLRRPGLC
jgi:hypothetical protein